MDRVSRVIIPFVVAALAGCAPAPESGAPSPATSTATSNERAAPRMDTPPPANADLAAMPAAATSAMATGQWFLQESDPPRAVWGVPASEGMLSFSCDRANAQLLLERQAIGVPDDVRLVSIDADGTRMDYPAERTDAALAPVLVTPIALDAPILDRMLMARRMAVTAGADVIATVAPGPSLRAVVDACRRGQPE